MPVAHPLDKMDMGDKILDDLDLIAWRHHEELQMQLFAKLHEIGGFFFVLVTKALVDRYKPKTSGIAAFPGDPELIGNGTAEDGIGKLGFFTPGELAHLPVSFLKLLGLPEFLICPEFEPVTDIENPSPVSLTGVERVDEGLDILLEVQGLLFEAVLLPVGRLRQGIQEPVPELLDGGIRDRPDTQLYIGIRKTIEVDSAQGLIES